MVLVLSGGGYRRVDFNELSRRITRDVYSCACLATVVFTRMSQSHGCQYSTSFSILSLWPFSAYRTVSRFMVNLVIVELGRH